ncbi:hypothetical protein EN780_07230 [Mesorhizobium sp. M4B.F.Ca.ET.089.01.1.1]|uniref:hypothetical protein n=1 Tax=Mesorhizobium sp. M4B.F.Ca.ET.089.01.1.1 TaxID=2496662 RepID=UPI000FE3AE53|nr:hypothetical protein [Mesorhizobium sp. M4B.F.Ca.ET.089.01.1.1]RWX69100.1 hypothetical protein EN780_07230 [Mesorhizobium sp. M4B.F.Ca.ET.089.01.1.1]
MPNEQMASNPNVAEPAQGLGVSVQVNPEDSVPFRPEPVFISLGLKRGVFTGYSGAAAPPEPMRIPPLDLKTEEGLLKALSLLGFEPGMDTIQYGFSTPAIFRASAKFRETIDLPGPNVPWPPAVIASQPPMIKPGIIANYIGAQAGFFQLSLNPLQLKLRELGVPFTLGGVTAPTDLRPQLFLVEHYQLASFRGDLARDDMVGSVSLSPGGSMTYKLIVKKKTSKSTELTSTVMDSQDQEAKSNFNKQIKDTADARFGRNNYNYGFDGSFHGEASVGFGEGSADAQVHARGATNEVREEFAESTASAIDTQVSEANRVRQQRMVTGTASTQTDEETESVMEKTAQNPTARPVNVGIFLIKEEFVSLLSLVDVEIAFRNGDPNKDRLVPLRKLGELLDAVIDRPEDRTEIATSIKDILQGIVDYQDKVRSIVKVDPSSPSGFSRDGQVKSEYQLRKSDGSVRRTLSVPGILIRDYRRFLRQPAVTVELPITEI